MPWCSGKHAGLWHHSKWVWNKTVIQIKYHINLIPHTSSNSWCIDCKHSMFGCQATERVKVYPRILSKKNYGQLICQVNLYASIYDKRVSMWYNGLSTGLWNCSKWVWNPVALLHSLWEKYGPHSSSKLWVK